MDEVLITGSSGFVGSNLVPYLRNQNLHVIPFSRTFEISYDHINSEYLNQAGVNCIIHLAGKAHDFSQSANPKEYYEVNTKLTIQLYNAFIQSTAEIFIYISSVKAVADHSNTPLTENTPAFPITNYGKSKLAAEQYMLAQSLIGNKRLYILRPCMIHGPGNKGNLNLLYQLVRKGIPYPLAAFNNARSFLSIENLCFVIHQLVKREDIASGIYHVADDMPMSTMDVVQIIADVLGKRSRIWKAHPSLIKSIAAIGDIIHLPLNSERLYKLTENYIVSNYKLVSALHLSLPVAAKDGLKRTIESFKDVA